MGPEVGRGERERILTVGELTAYIRGLLEQDFLLAGVWVRGEISDFKVYQQSGHMYFSLKDERAVLSCVMFRSRARGVGFTPANGMRVVVRGYVSVFERSGRYQLYAEEMEPDGLGARYLQLLQLRERLEREGLFAAGRKRQLPAMPRTVGVVTSQDGAALRDILRVLRQRFPGVRVVIAHCAVQGDSAPAEIAAALRALNAASGAEVIIVGRGGGSVEDLWAFNTEEVVRAVSESRIPVISAVGHEVDYTLVDLAADARAATPTHAAQMAVPEVAELARGLEQRRQRLCRALQRHLQADWQRLDAARGARVWRDTGVLLGSRRQRLGELRRHLERAGVLELNRARHRAEQVRTRLDALNPLRVMERGYAVVRRLEAGEIVRSVEEVRIGDALEVCLKDGILRVQVAAKESGMPWET
jgi:exodeoxyribonuclease VII large subunit